MESRGELELDVLFAGESTEKASLTSNSSQKRRRKCSCIIEHNSKFKIVWDWIVLILVIITAIQIPYIASFPSDMAISDRESVKNILISKSKVSPVIVLSFIVDLMFFLDILINFRTTFVRSETDEIVSEPKKIAKNYLRTWFIIDFVAAIPFDWFISEGGGQTDEQTATLVGLLKSARLLRLFRVARKLDRYSEYGIAVLFLLMCFFTLSAHWLACIWHAVGDREKNDPAGWIYRLRTTLHHKENNVTTIPSGTRYIAALYFVMTSLTSVGFGNIAANTAREQIFSILVMLIGALMYACIFGNMVAIVQRLYTKAAKFHTEMNTIKEFLRFYKIPDDLRRSIQTYVRHEWNVNDGVDMQSVLQRFPDCIQSDVCYELYHHIFCMVPAFREATISCMRALAKKFKTMHLQIGHYALRQGDQINILYLIGKGAVEVIRDGDLVTLLAKGSMVGYDLNTLPTIPKANADLRASNFVVLHYIQKYDLLAILEAYPKFAKHFKENFSPGYCICDENEEGTIRPATLIQQRMHVTAVARSALRLSFTSGLKRIKSDRQREVESQEMKMQEMETCEQENKPTTDIEEPRSPALIPNGHPASSKDGLGIVSGNQTPQTSGEQSQECEETIFVNKDNTSSNFDDFIEEDKFDDHEILTLKTLETKLVGLENEFYILKQSFDLQFEMLTKLVKHFDTRPYPYKEEEKESKSADADVDAVSPSSISADNTVSGITIHSAEKPSTDPLLQTNNI